MSEWKECKLADVIDIKHGYAFKGEFFSAEETENILVTPGNFQIGGGFKLDKLKYYKGDIPFDYVLKSNDVIVTMTDLSKESDTLGYSAIVPEAPGKKFLHNQRIGLLKSKADYVSLKFIYWLLRTEEYRWHVIGSSSGSTVSHTSPSRILEYRFLLPSLPEQHAIAAVLSSLDHKIDLLHRQNKTLESLAETLWRKMFVEDADPNWEEGILGDLVTVSTGKGLKRDEYIDSGIYPVMGANGEIGRTNNYLTEAKLILTGRVGTLGQLLINYNQKVWISDNVLIIEPKDDKHFYFVYFLLKEIEFENLNVGSTQPLVTQTDLKQIECSIPRDSLAETFQDQCACLFDKIQRNMNQIRTLSHLRDTLLPKLMSGTIKVGVD